MVLNQNLAHIKNSPFLTFLSVTDCVDNSRDMSRDHFAKNRKLLTIWRLELLSIVL